MTRDSNEHQARFGNAQTILDSITDAFFFLNSNWEFSYVNRQTEKILGTRASELLGKTLWEAYPGAIGSEFERMYRKAAQEQAPLTFTSYYPDHDRWYEVHVYPAQEGLSVYFRNVTERMKAETRQNALIMLSDVIRELKTPEEIMYRASEVLGEALAVSRVGYGTIDPVAETLNVVRDWNAPDVETLAGTLNLRDYGSFIDDMKAGRFIAINNVDTDFRTAGAASASRQRSAGAFVNVPVIEQNRLVAMLFVNHAQERHWTAEELSFIREVAERTRTASERLRNEMALRESEAKFRTIANAMPQMVWSTRADGYHDYYNQQWYDYIGMPDGATDGEEWNGMFHPEDQPQAWDRWRHSLQTGDTYEIQYRLRHHSGQYRWVLGRALPVRDDAGKIIRWMGTCTDIHDQKIAEVELRESGHRKDEFLAMLAHELRNPLAPISAAAELLTLTGYDEKRACQASEIIARQVSHMTNLINDLLDVSRVTRGLVALEHENVDLKTVINGAIEQARPLIETRQHTLRLRIASATANMKGDKTRLIQIIVNLLTNAAKYSPHGGEIELTLDVFQARAEICIRDNGIGIEPAILPHIFKLFTQGSRTPDRAQGGLGLGLSLVKSLTDLHGGQIMAHSEGTGKGSVFTLTFPLIGNEEARQGEFLLEQFPPRAITPVSLMIVDDNLDAARSLATLLDAVGHAVSVCEDGTSALEAIALEAPQVFILDIGLPGMDGYELARRLRESPTACNAVLIALTGYGQEHDRLLSKAAGFNHHFVKPMDTLKLGSILAQVAMTAATCGNSC
jgi:PAS domain S-box-containing protein